MMETPGMPVPPAATIPLPPNPLFPNMPDLSHLKLPAGMTIIPPGCSINSNGAPEFEPMPQWVDTNDNAQSPSRNSEGALVLNFNIYFRELVLN